ACLAQPPGPGEAESALRRPLGYPLGRPAMDWSLFWSAVTALAAVVAVVGAVAALLATAMELQQARLDREADFYRNLTPFLSIKFVDLKKPAVEPLFVIYCDGGGPAFDVQPVLVAESHQWPANSQPYLRKGAPSEELTFPALGKGSPNFEGRVELS